MSLPLDDDNQNFGVPLSNVEAIIKEKEEGEGEEGEIAIRGCGVLDGFFPNNQNDSQFFPTGIFGKFGEDGNLTIIKEKK